GCARHATPRLETVRAGIARSEGLVGDDQASHRPLACGDVSLAVVGDDVGYLDVARRPADVPVIPTLTLLVGTGEILLTIQHDVGVHKKCDVVSVDGDVSQHGPIGAVDVQGRESTPPSVVARDVCDHRSAVHV